MSTAQMFASYSFISQIKQKMRGRTVCTVKCHIHAHTQLEAPPPFCGGKYNDYMFIWLLSSQVWLNHLKYTVWFFQAYHVHTSRIYLHHQPVFEIMKDSSSKWNRVLLEVVPSRPALIYSIIRYTWYKYVIIISQLLSIILQTISNLLQAVMLKSS